jgi:hypothetical protein
MSCTAILPGVACEVPAIVKCPRDLQGSCQQVGAESSRPERGSGLAFGRVSRGLKWALPDCRRWQAGPAACGEVLGSERRCVCKDVDGRTGGQIRFYRPAPLIQLCWEGSLDASTKHVDTCLRCGGKTKLGSERRAQRRAPPGSPKGKAGLTPAFFERPGPAHRRGDRCGIGLLQVGAAPGEPGRRVQARARSERQS